MIRGFDVQGRCPGVHDPMLGGDGLIVRLKPRTGTLSPTEARMIATAAKRYGNGIVELTSRASLQLRGIAPRDHPRVIGALVGAGLVLADGGRNNPHNVVVSPFGRGAGRSASVVVACALGHRLEGITQLPAKFGFAVDTGPTRVLADVSADIRVERAGTGELLVRCEGLELGESITLTGKKGEAELAADAAARLARWFIESGGSDKGRGRMIEHIASGARPPGYREHRGLPAPCSPQPPPGLCAEGILVAAEFGQLPAAALIKLSDMCTELRTTPWRMLLLVGTTATPRIEELIFTDDDPRLRVSACTGAPGCAQAHAQTRSLARTLAPRVPAGSHLHVSGCRKGCAMPRPAPFTLIASEHGYSLVKDGTARADAICEGLSGTAIEADPSLVFGAR